MSEPHLFRLTVEPDEPLYPGSTVIRREGGILVHCNLCGAFLKRLTGREIFVENPVCECRQKKLDADLRRRTWSQ